MYSPFIVWARTKGDVVLEARLVSDSHELQDAEAELREKYPGATIEHAARG